MKFYAKTFVQVGGIYSIAFSIASAKFSQKSTKESEMENTMDCIITTSSVADSNEPSNCTEFNTCVLTIDFV